MHLKDYYKILELEPSATLPEIKKAFRKLAQQYHPDKNNNNPYSRAYFNDIKEAYETLTNPAEKENYLQQRWYNRAMGKDRTSDTITPAGILKKALEFEKYTSRLDQFRLHSNTLFELMDKLLSDTTISQLATFRETEVNKQIILTLIKPVSMLEFQHAELIGKKLFALAGEDSACVTLIERTLTVINKKAYWQSRQWIFILVITAAICWLIWYSGS